MSASNPSLLPLFRSEHQARLLAELFFGEPGSGSELARRTGIPQPTVARELARLEAAGLVASHRYDTAKRVTFTVNTDLPYGEALRKLVAYAAGVPHLVQAEYENVDGIDEVFIHGSWAARFLGEDGPTPNDVDIVVVSAIHTRFTLAGHRSALEQTTGLNVDQMVLPPDNERLAVLRLRSVEVISPRSALLET